MFDSLRNNSKVIVYIVVAAFLVSGGLMGFGSYMSNRSSTAGQSSSSRDIATVNDTRISREQYLNVLRNQAPRQELTRSQIIPFRLNVLNSIIERELILQQAREMNVQADVTDEEVEEVINNILQENDMEREQLIERLSEQGNSLAEFKASIRSSLETNNIIQKTAEKSYDDVEVTDKEIKEAYEESSGEQEFSEVRSDIKERLQQEKENEAFNNWLEDLKAEAEITINDPILQAYSQLEKGEYDKAVENFKMLAENDPGPMMYTYLARAYAGKENNEQAVEVFNKALEEYPDDWQLHYEFGNFYREQDKKNQALTQYELAADKAGENLMTHYRLYMVFNALGEEEKAAEEMEKIQQIQERRNQETEELEGVEEPEDIEDINEGTAEEDLTTEENQEQ